MPYRQLVFNTSVLVCQGQTKCFLSTVATSSLRHECWHNKPKHVINRLNGTSLRVVSTVGWELPFFSGASR